MERLSARETHSTDMSRWIADAACRSESAELFDKGDTSAERGQTVAIRDDAKKVCGRCAVQVACLDWAVASGETHGIWGGMTTDERTKLRRK